MSQINSQFSLSLLHPRHWLTWCGLGLFYLLSRLPLVLQDKMAARAGIFLMRRNRKRYRVVEKNLRTCFPDKQDDEIERLISAHFELIAISLMHYGLFWWSAAKRLENMLDRQSFELIEQSRARGKNVIVLLSHCTGLEFAVYAISHSFKSAGPYKHFPNPVIDWLIYKARVSNTGGSAFAREDGLRPVIRYARQGQVIVYLADEDLGAEACEFADFFGVQKATIPVLGRLAKSCQADVLPAIACYDRERRKYVVKIFEAEKDYPAADQAADTLTMNKMIEKTILYCPQQYFWTMKFFKTRPPGEDSFY